ncbi:unnamed protein product [Effrenium voratum]|nr:unnamed protein product [Effrenium voratum]
MSFTATGLRSWGWGSVVQSAKKIGDELANSEFVKETERIAHKAEENISQGASEALRRVTEVTDVAVNRASETIQQLDQEMELHRVKCNELQYSFQEVALAGEVTSACLRGSCDASELQRDLEGLVSAGCRESHPSLLHAWPLQELGKAEGYLLWMERIHQSGLPWTEVISWDSIRECPAAACGALAAHVLSAESWQDLLKILGVQESRDFLLDVGQKMQFCYDRILADKHQQQMFSWLGLIVAALEMANAHLRHWSHQLKPRNPHHEEGRTVWHDYYSDLYPAVDYSEQFDLQWQLALEQPKSDFGMESSVRLDDCALNDMIASTFGQQDFLKNCSDAARAEHESLERGISRQNFVTLDASRFDGADALDVGCGFGRWTAMLLRIGARVTSVDASPNAVKSTRRFNPDTHQMSLFELPTLKNFEAGFDLVICWGVLHHTHDPHKGFKIIASALREGGVLFIQVYNDRAKAGFHYTQQFRKNFHQLQTREEKLDFLRRTHKAAGADIFDHLDGMLTFYNWVVHEETVRSWFLNSGFTDYWKVWNYKYLGRKRPVLAPVRDDMGVLLTQRIGESVEEGRNYPLLGFHCSRSPECLSSEHSEKAKELQEQINPKLKQAGDKAKTSILGAASWGAKTAIWFQSFGTSHQPDSEEESEAASSSATPKVCRSCGGKGIDYLGNPCNDCPAGKGEAASSSAGYPSAPVQPPAAASMAEASASSNGMAETVSGSPQKEEEQARTDAQEQAKKEAAEKAQREAEEKAKKQVEEAAQKAAEEKAEKEADEAAQKAAEEKAAQQAAEEKAKKEAEEAVQKAAQEKAKKEAEEAAQKARQHRRRLRRGSAEGS